MLLVDCENQDAFICDRDDMLLNCVEEFELLNWIDSKRTSIKRFTCFDFPNQDLILLIVLADRGKEFIVARER